jgi:glycerate 2-kinase
VPGDRIAVQARNRQQLIATYCCEWSGLGRQYAAQGFFLLIKTSHIMLASNPRQLLLQLFESAVDAVSATRCLPSFLQQEAPRGGTLVIGAGKGAAEMAKVVEDCWPHALSGLVITPYGHGADCRRIEVMEAAHPVPDEAGRRGAQRLLEMVGGLTEDDLVICLISGGGSSLLAMPVDGMNLAQKQAINSALLKSGATISEINCVRKHLSAIKGGRLALACAPARLITLLISDVPGDDPGIVASGPTLPDATTCRDALRILAKYSIALPENVRRLLESEESETPKPGDPRFERNALHVVASANEALTAAANVARCAGITPYIFSDEIEGEARVIGGAHAAIAKRVARRGEPFARPCVLISGGETTVTVQGDGRGGRNAEFLLGLAVALDGCPDVYAIACDTDGIDGSEHNAGAICGPDSLARGRILGLDPVAMLDNNDAYSFFEGLGELVVTGPTRTNVNDFRAILIL